MNTIERITFLLAAAGWAVFGPVLRADPAPTPPLPAWQEGDEWYLNVTSYPRGNLDAPDPLDRGKQAAGDPVHFDLRVQIAGSEPIRDAVCWQVDFIPVNAPTPIGGPVRVLVGKEDGWTRRIVIGGTTTDIDPAAGAPMLAVPLPGIPLELFPRMKRPVFPPQNGVDCLTLEQYPQSDGFNEVALLRFMGRTRVINKVVVRQGWSPNEKWWTFYERFLYGNKDLEARVGFPPTPEPPAGKAAEDAHPQPTPPVDFLAADPRLQQKVSVDMHNAKLRALLDTIGSQVGVALTLDSRLTQEDPTFGGYYTREAPAHWALHGIATWDLLADGRWEKTEAGYRLCGAWRKPITASPHGDQGGVFGPLRWWLVGGSLFALTVVAGWFVYRRFQKRATPAPAAPSPRKAPR